MSHVHGRIGLISNPKSGGYVRSRAALDRLLPGMPEILDRELTSDSALPDLMDDLAAAGIEVLIVNGGDGTAMRILSALFESRAFTTLPAVALLQGGTANMTAADLGARGAPARAVVRILERLRSGKLQEHLIDRPVLKVDNILSHAPMRGFFFGLAGIVDSIRLCATDFISRGIGGEIAHFGTLLTFLTRAAVRGPANAGIGGLEVEVRFPDAPGFAGQQLLLFASTLDRLVLRSKPFWGEGDGPVHLTSVAQGAPRPLLAVPRALLGLGRGLPRKHYRSVRTVRAELRFDGPFTIDGEFFHAGAGRPLIVSADERLRFVHF
ncbi:MAG: diacylglycerol kinase family protein [Geminicoccaceae bacterium]